MNQKNQNPLKDEHSQKGWQLKRSCFLILARNSCKDAWDACQKSFIINLLIILTVDKLRRGADGVPTVDWIKSRADEEYQYFSKKPMEHIHELEKIGWIKVEDENEHIAKVHLTTKCINDLSPYYSYLAEI